jgi:Homeodomain-like domain
MPQPNQKVEVALGEATRKDLENLVRSGKAPARQVRWARVLLLADADQREGRHPDWYIVEQTGVSARQVVRIRQMFVREGIGPTHPRKRRSDAGVPKVLDGRAEAQLVTLCCSTPPAGHQRWSLQLLASELGRLQLVASVCNETVRRCLKKIALSPGKRNASAFRSETVPASWRAWRKSSTSTRPSTTKRIR